MQKSKLKLQSIVYEVTGACKNSCNYCGSKHGWNEEIDVKRAYKIIDEIVKFPPEEINVSGGDPLLMSIEFHEFLVNKLKGVGVVCKILVNPKSLKPEQEKIFRIYNYFGISINTKDEFDIMNSGLEMQLAVDLSNQKKLTIITNFNNTNIFMFDKIAEMVKILKCSWQVQMTIYKKENDENAIYNNDQAFEYFKQKVESRNDINLIVADTLRRDECHAGTSVIGITSSGEVLPCLSMVSWSDNIKQLSQGNILEKGLEYIWKNEFKEYRFSEFKSCKDHCKNRIICDKLNNQNFLKKLKELEGDCKTYYPTKRNDIGRPLLYGVGTQPTYVYGVTPGVFAYAVFSEPFQDPIVTMYAVIVNENTNASKSVENFKFETWTPTFTKNDLGLE